MISTLVAYNNRGVKNLVESDDMVHLVQLAQELPFSFSRLMGFDFIRYSGDRNYNAERFSFLKEARDLELLLESKRSILMGRWGAYILGPGSEDVFADQLEETHFSRISSWEDFIKKVPREKLEKYLSFPLTYDDLVLGTPETGYYKQLSSATKKFGALLNVYQAVNDIIINYQESINIENGKVNFDFKRLKKFDEIRSKIENLKLKTAQLPHYSLTKHIGSGGAGDVYHAVDDFSGTDVKIKVFREDMKTSMREAREKEGRSVDNVVRGMMTKMRSRISDFTNIGQVYHGGSTEDGRIFIVGEYVDGGAVEEEVDGEYRIRDDISGKAVFDIFDKMLQGMQVLHDAGMLWKDVKLRNLLVSKDHSKVKIDDLEMLSGLDEMVQEPRYSKASDRYAAPEVMQDPTQASVASEIYSAGVCLLTMLTRKSGIMDGVNTLPREKYALELVNILRDHEFGIANIPPFSVIQDLEIKSCIFESLAYDPVDRPGVTKELRQNIKNLNNERYYREGIPLIDREFYEQVYMKKEERIDLNQALIRDKTSKLLLDIANMNKTIPIDTDSSKIMKEAFSIIVEETRTKIKNLDYWKSEEFLCLPEKAPEWGCPAV